MPTKPIEPILNRDLSRVNANEFIVRYCPLLDEIANYGTNLYRRATDRMPDLLAADGVPFLIYLNVLEMADGTSELLRQSAVTPAIPVVRTTFESTLALDYMLEADTANRANAWLVAYLVEQIQWTSLVLGTDRAGHQFHQAMQTDTVGSNIDLAPFAAHATKKKAEFEAVLNKSALSDAVAERTNLIQSTPRNPYPNWYSSFGGPSNLRALSKHLNREAQYLVLYKHFSGVAHGQNLSRFIRRAASPDPLVRLLRDSSEFRQLADYAISFALRCTRLLSKQQNEEAQYAKWYTEEIRPGFMGADIDVV